MIESNIGSYKQVKKGECDFIKIGVYTVLLRGR